MLNIAASGAIIILHSAAPGSPVTEATQEAIVEVVMAMAGGMVLLWALSILIVKLLKRS